MINKSRLIKLTQKLISYDSVNPPGNELACAQFIEKDMRSLGLHIQKISFEKNRPNIIATLKGSLPRKQAVKEAILLTPHFDTVPFGRGWKYSPLSGKIVGGKLYGRGATDDKGNCASCMEVMRSLVESGYKPRKDIIMAATVDEETGSKCGIIPLLEKKKMTCGFAIVMDSTEFDAVVAQKGLIHGRVQIFGKKAHSAYNWRGISAVEIAARVILRLTKLKYAYKKHSLLRAPTMNVGVINGGDKCNMVADFVEFTIDARFCPGTKAKEVISHIHTAIKKETTAYKIEIDDIQDSYEIDQKHPYIDSYLKLAKKMKCPAKVKGSEGATVITLFQDHHTPAFATGWGAHETAHTTDEYIFVKSLVNGSRLLDAYVREIDQL